MSQFAVVRHVYDSDASTAVRTNEWLADSRKGTWTSNPEEAQLFDTWRKARHAAARHDGLTTPATPRHPH